MLKPEKQALISAAEVFTHLEKRRGILEGICITGGEPTLEIAKAVHVTVQGEKGMAQNVAKFATWIIC